MLLLKGNDSPKETTRLMIFGPLFCTSYKNEIYNYKLQ